MAGCIFLAVGLAPALAAAQSQHRGSLDDQIACTPDVYRLCAQSIPDEDDIVDCLRKNKPKLSAACHEVFSRPENAAPPKPPAPAQ